MPLAQGEHDVDARAAPAAAQDRAARSDRRAILAAWVALLAVTSAPYLKAQWSPPAGTGFTGIFFYADDFYQYLSFVEQAMHGRFLFRNKFDPAPHAASVVNLEWWAGGALAAVLGHHPIVGFHALRPLTLGVLVLGAARLLRRAGLRRDRLGWALALFLTGGGLGWLRLWLGRPGWQVPDILMGIYPWHQALLNAHTALGMGLLLLTLSLFLDWQAGERRAWPWLVTGWVLGLSRPYDLLTFILVAGAWLMLELVRGREWSRFRRGALALAALAPALVYYGALMILQPGYRGWSGEQSQDLNPPLLEFVFALAPAAALAVAGWRRADDEGRDVRWVLAIWCLFLVGVGVLYRSPLMKPFMPGLGVGLLLLACVVAPPRWLPAAVLALSPTSLFLLWRVFHPFPHWFVPRDYFQAVSHLEHACQPRDVAVAPVDLSLMVAGLTPCSVVYGHRGLTPRYADRMRESRVFYDPQTPATWRREYLGGVGARFVLLPAGRGDWLGPDHAFTRRLTTPLLELWEAPARSSRDQSDS